MGWRSQQARDDAMRRERQALPLARRYNWPAIAAVVAAVIGIALGLAARSAPGW